MDNLIEINTLGNRYHLKSRQSVANRLKSLDIKPTRRGKITQDDLQLLDELDKHINSGGTIDNFAKSPEVMPVDKLDKWEEPQETLTIQMLLAFIEKILLHQQPPPSPLSQFEELEKAVIGGWVLPTSLVRSLTGSLPRGDACGGKQRFPRGSFVFVRTGKVGREAGWIVQKLALTPKN